MPAQADRVARYFQLSSEVDDMLRQLAYAGGDRYKGRLLYVVEDAIRRLYAAEGLSAAGAAAAPKKSRKSGG